MHQKRFSRLGVTSFILLAAAFQRSPATRAAPSTFTKRLVILTQKPGWTISGAFAADGSLLLVDALYSRICRYSPLGVFSGEVKALPERPSRLSTIHGGYLLEGEAARLVRLDQRFTPIERVSLLKYSKESRARVGGVYGWAPLGDGSKILAFADIQAPDGRWQSSFIRVPLHGALGFEILRSMKLTDPARSYYLLGNPHIAALGDQGFFIVMDQRPSIYKILPNSQMPHRLSRLEKALGKRPQLAEKKGSSSTKSIYSSLERSEDFVSGLYAAGDALYLLTRTRGLRATTWFLSKLDPAREAVLYTRRLPTSAHFLTVIPGPEEWAFVERGPVVGLLQQDIASILFVPTEEIESEGALSTSSER